MRRIKPNVEAQIAAAIAAGWPLIAVAEQFRVSLSTVKRIGNRSGVISGSTRGELVDVARESLRDALTSEFAANEGARLVRAQIVLCHDIHTKAAELLEAITIDEGCDPLKAAKILSACATAGKLASDGLRRVLTLAAEPEIVEALPELIVRDYTEEECDAIRAERDSWAPKPRD